MAHLEIELKAYCDDLSAIAVELKRLDAEFVADRYDIDTYYNHPSRDFAQTDEAFRIRRVGNECCLTYKGPKIAQVTKTRFEAEVAIGDPEEMACILERLGFVETITIRKKRHLYELDGVEFCLDDVEGLGTFVELETADEDREAGEKRLFECAEKVGLHRFESRSYLELLFEKR